MSHPPEPDAAPTITEEAGLTPGPGEAPRIRLSVTEGERVAQGAPVAALTDHPGVVLTAPMGATVARAGLSAGRRLSEIVFFREAGADRHRHDVSAVDTPGGLREALGASGLWTAFRARPFGRLPPLGQSPAAILVMALDARPEAPDPLEALAGREAAFDRGLSALLELTRGTVFLCLPRGASPPVAPRDRLRVLRARAAHPAGRAGFQILDACPAGPERVVWDVHAEDVAAIGAFLETGLLPETRLVALAGGALDRPRVLRCQPGADLRALTWRHAAPGPHLLLSGDAAGGRPARWLAPRERLVTALPAPAPARPEHWLLAALRRAARPLPLIPTAALRHAMAGAMPVAAFLRAVASGDAETAVRLGALSLLPEDLTLADHVSAADPPLSARFADLLDRIAREAA